MRLLVVGPDGQLGHDMVRAGRAAGEYVTTLGRADLDLALAGPDDIDRRLEGVEVEAVVNCAGYTRVDDAESDADAAFALNARAPAHLAAACAGRGVRLVQVSTDYVFDGASRQPYREADRPAPLNVYGASKLTGEALVRTLHPDGAIIVRTASLFGSAGALRARQGRGGNFVETILRRAAEGQPLRVVDDVVMSPTSTADLARAILDLLHGDAPAGTYHLANAGRASWYQFAREILAAAAVPADLEPIPAADYPTPARRPAFSALDTAKAVAAGCILRSWRETLEEYLMERRRSP